MIYKILKVISAFSIALPFLIGCQAVTRSNESDELTIVSEFDILPTPTIQELIIPDEQNASLTPTSMSTASLSAEENLLDTPTTTLPPVVVAEQPTRVTPVPTVEFDLPSFEEMIVFVGWDAIPEQTMVGIFDPLTAENWFVHPPGGATDVVFGGRPLWSPDKEYLLVIGIDQAQKQISFWISNQYGENSQQIGHSYPRFNEETNETTGLFSFGWDRSSNWVAYSYLLSPVRSELNLLNVETGEIIETPMKSLYWLEWSPHSDSYAYSDLESLYVASPASFDNPETYSWSRAIGLMAWHPTENRLLVVTSENVSANGFDTLWTLNVDSGTHELIGEFPHINHFSYSPDGTYIALHSYYNPTNLNQLVILDSSTGQLIQEIELPSVFFSGLKWLDNATLALDSVDNIYLIPVNQPYGAMWVLSADNPFYDLFQNIDIVDW